ncbi:MAG: hypothetical protein ACRD5G_14325 [Candidatus Acidiferrales bacterium]
MNSDERSTEDLPTELPEEVYDVPEGNWVVLSADQRRMVAHHHELSAALKEARRLGEPNGIVMMAVHLREHWVI